MATLKLRAIGNSVGVVLPKELLAQLKVKEGDTLHAVAQPEGGVLLMPLDPDVAEQLQIGRDIMRRYRNVLRELAK